MTMPAVEASRDCVRSKKRDPELLKPPATAAAWCTRAPARRRRGVGEVYADDPTYADVTGPSWRLSRAAADRDQPRGNQGVPPS
jgi:hypothetical protein